MATNFPTSLDTSTTIPAESSSTSLAVNHVTAHQNIQDSIEAIEAKIGVDSSAVTTSHDYKLSGVTGSDKAVSKTGTETLTNKTLTSPTITGATITTSSVNGVTLQIGGSATDFLAADGTYQTGSVANASATVKGIVELATSAEITAGTATGGTGAALVVTPDALASSTPVFSGLGITNAVRLLRLAGYSPAANTTENTVYTTTIPANALSTNGLIKVETPLYWGTSATAETWTLRLKFGGTTLLTTTFQSNATGGGNNVSAQGIITAYIINNASTSSQTTTLHLAGGVNMDATTNQVPTSFSNVADSTASIDTTSSQTLTMTVQRTNGSGGSASFKQTIVQVIKNA